MTSTRSVPLGEESVRVFSTLPVKRPKPLLKATGPDVALCPMSRVYYHGTGRGCRPPVPPRFPGSLTGPLEWSLSLHPE